MSWKEIGYVLGSPLTKKIMECLNESDRPLTPLEISKKTDIARSNVSTKLGQLRKQGLAVCINPEIKKFRFYKITPKGKRVLKAIKQMKGSVTF